MTTTRKPIAKKLRFDVFKRDSFTCQYCGATPPGVILHVDHITPVVDGGSNDIDNLLTSCDACNLGKGATPLSEIPKSLKEKAAEIAEREEQIKGYNKVLMNRARRIDEDCWKIIEALEHDQCQDSYSRVRIQSIKTFLGRLPYADVLDAAQVTASKWWSISERAFRYFCGICWNKIRDTGR